LPGYIKDGRLDIGIFHLKLINNIIRILSTTPKKSVVLFDLYTLEILKAIFEDFKKIEPSVLKDITDCRREGKQFYEGVDINQFLEDFNRDLEMMNIFTEMLQEDVLPQIKKPLCYRCINDRISMGN
jgi:hypothetical protein